VDAPAAPIRIGGMDIMIAPRPAATLMNRAVSTVLADKTRCQNACHGMPPNVWGRKQQRAKCIV